MNILKNIKSILVVFAFLAATAWTQEYVIIVNPGNGASSVSKAELKRIFNGRMKSWSGGKVVPINQMYTSPVTAKFVKDATGMSVEEYKSYWVEQQIKGKGTQPMLQKSDAAVKLMVASIPGAIGYITKGSEDATVKVISK